jgi:hypothetical protein
MTGLGLAIRFVHLGASLFLAGFFTFLLLVARPAFQSEGGGPIGIRALRYHRTNTLLATFGL